jgi:hypothetical protein
LAALLPGSRKGTREARLSKKHIPTPDQRRTVEIGAAMGLREEDLSVLTGVGLKTLRRAYKEELRTGHLKASANIAKRLYQHAMGDDKRTSIAACIFWLKTRCGWHEHGEGVQVNVSQSQSQGVVLKVPMPLASEEEWNAAAAEQQAKLLAQSPTLTASVFPANSTAGRERQAAQGYTDEGMATRPRRRYQTRYNAF